MTGSLIFAAMFLAGQPVIDTHVHLHKGQESVEAYKAQADAAGVKVQAFAAMWFGGPNQALAGDPADITRNNDALIALAGRHPGMIPVATVHPYDGEAALAELDRVAARGVKILKIHPHTQKFDAADPRVLTLVTRAGELGLIVLIDNASILPGDNEKLFNLALAAPKTRFIYAHMGGFNFRFWNILKLARTAENLFAENIYFDISGPLTMGAGSPIEDELVWTMRNVGIEHLLLASDFPQVSLQSAVEALDRLPLTDSEKAKIRYENARKLFGEVSGARAAQPEVSATTQDAVRRKAAECGLAPDQIVWELDGEGQGTALLTTNGDLDNMSGTAFTCMVKWAAASRVRISFISEPPPAP